MKIQVITNKPSDKIITEIQFFDTKEALPSSIQRQEFSAEINSTFFLCEGKNRRLLVGLGQREKITGDQLRKATGTAIRFLQKMGITNALLNISRYTSHVQRIVEGALMGSYHFDTFLPKERQIKKRFATLNLLVNKDQLQKARVQAERGKVFGEATNFTRSIGDLPGNYVYPQTLAEIAQDLGRQYRHLKVSVLDERRLASGGFGGLTAVGGGSVHPPRLIVLQYQGGRKTDAPLVFVGKAITFDSGGISVKPADRMEEMKFDKMGGCTVLGIMQAVARLKPKKNVIGVIASAENLLDSHSYRPGDIVTTYDGKTIEVLNTDAEGRVVLADALAYARIHFRPALIMDFATLTGAAVIALGTHRAGLFSNEPEIANKVEKAAQQTGDRVWQLPHDEPYHQQIKSDVAMVKNTGGREGGASTAAAFLEKWVEDTPWAHLDIAGTAWTTKDLPYLAKGATGYGVRLGLEFLEM